ncbi:type IV secretory system conjugative DNA transfer family protein [Metamycoplasma hyosynoviae]|uniref:type IV secretory system conjugative DNA transfer family protein n=1 Tax=Metamycoplasma hyosynoviae TaxID=29559 RepID=UPI0023582DC6|nr:type IV secretory system conjugative DNA transfer family protein [Metamycoplasma hyosynoviae]MDC8900150.1 type IV secretory system conjugative DNA transfer family protein [Metamycoplasma hyosynoviae]MDC8937704.1 type IV secretory system conjugative DNA transfer family protein [Metamycoplasma hyosynoviae]
MDDERIAKGKIVGKTLLSIIASVFLFFVFAFIINILIGKNKSPANYQLFWKSTVNVMKTKTNIFVYAGIGIMIFTFGFIFWPQIKLLGKKISNYLLGAKASQNWLWNYRLNEGSKSKYNKLFRKMITDKTEANWLFTFSKSQKYWYINDKDDNAIVNGPPGTGKTHRVILPNIEFMAQLDYYKKPHLIISDPKKEIIKFTGKLLEENDYKIYTIDFSEPKLSLKWNPLSYAWDLVKNDNKFKDLTMEDRINKALEVINNVIESLNWGKATNGNMWISQGKKSLIVIANFLLFLALDDKNLIHKDNFNFETIASLLNTSHWENDKKISSWILYAKKRALVDNDYYWKKIYNNIEDLSKTPKETFGGILAEAQSVLNVFNNDENLKMILRDTDSFDLVNIASDSKPFAIFIHYPDHKPTSHFLVSMLVEQIYQALIETANKTDTLKLDRKAFFLLDEFGNLPVVVNFDNKLTICRSRNIFFMLVVQDYNQIKKYNIYGEGTAQVIKNSCQVVYFLASNDEQTLNDISKALGTKEVVAKSYTSSNTNNNSSSTESEKSKPVMEVAELKSKKPDDLIIIKNGYKPILIKTLLAYKYFSNDNYVYTKNESKLIRNADFELFDIRSLEKLIRINAAEEKQNNQNKQIDTNNNENNGLTETQKIKRMKIVFGKLKLWYEYQNTKNDHMRTLIPHKKNILKGKLDRIFSEMWDQYVNDDLESDLINILWAEAKEKQILNYHDLDADTLIDLLHPDQKLQINKNDKTKT